MQSLFLRVLKAQLILLITSMMFFTTGCEDDDHDHAHDDEGHTDAEGFVLETEDEIVVYKQFEGEVDTTLTGVSVAVGETLELLVHFLDHDGDEIEHDDDDEHTTEESELAVTITSGSTFATVEAEEHDETGSSTEHHEMAIEITG